MREKWLATRQYLSIRFCPRLGDKFESINQSIKSRMVCSNYDPDPRKNVCKNTGSPSALCVGSGFRGHLVGIC